MKEELGSCAPVNSVDGGAPSSAIKVIMARRYVCPYCHRGRAKHGSIYRHMEFCWKNPAAKSCGSCENYCEAEDRFRDTYQPAGCAEGVKWDCGPNGVSKPVQCAKWSPLMAPLGASTTHADDTRA